jgi:hypothetical protein
MLLFLRGIINLLMRFTLALAAFAISTVAFGQAVDTPFQIRYAANLDIGDSVVNITNSGASSVGGAGTTLCANLYTFDPAEELISCCSCSVTPNALQSLSVRNSLISNTLTAAIPTSVVIKLLGSIGPTCNPSTVGTGANVLATGLLAWGTTIHANITTTPITYFGSETAFSPATLSAAELAHITSFCGFIQANASGFGICKGCAAGGLGAATSGQ